MQTIFATRRESLDTLLYTQTSDPANEVQATASAARLSEHKQLCFDDVDPSANAGLTQRPECDLYTVEVGGSNPSARTIPLTRGLFALVSPEDYEAVSQFKWTAGSFNSKSGYAYRSVWGADGKCRSILLHRVILNAEKGQIVDHRNGDTFDCRRSNLRVLNFQIIPIQTAVAR